MSARAHWARPSGLLDVPRPGAAPRVDAGVRASATELLRLYAIGYDEADPELLSACFGADVECETTLRGHLVARFLGRDQAVIGIMEVIRGQGPGQRRHLMTNEVVEALDDGGVRVHAYAAVVLSLEGRVDVVASAVYRVDMVETGAGFTIARMRLGMDEVTNG